MNRFTPWTALAGMCLAIAAVAVAQETREQKPKEGAAAPAEDEMMKKMMELGAPGPHHKHLDAMAGKWTYELKHWMDPAGEAETMTGTAESKWVYGGRFLEEKVEGDMGMPGPDGKPMMFYGTSVVGYDNLKQEYTNVWYDNMGTSMWILTGKCDQDGKVLTFTGNVPDPMTGNKAKKVRIVTKVESKDKHTSTFYGHGPDGKEVREMEIAYSRAK